MAASFCASFLIFLMTGFYSIYFGLTFTDDFAVKCFVSVVLVFNAVFYHYVAAYTEMDKTVRTALVNMSRFEWILRVANQCILLSLWFWLDHGWLSFGRALLLLYASFLTWDLLTWKSFPNHRLAKLDVAGTVLSVVYVYGGSVVLGEVDIQPDSERSFYMFFGAFCILYFLLPVVGMAMLKFNPLGREFRNRPDLH